MYVQETSPTWPGQEEFGAQIDDAVRAMQSRDRRSLTVVPDRFVRLQVCSSSMSERVSE